MKNPDPRLTVLMTVYNGDRFIRHAIESVLGQTYRNFEFLIVNDGSTDRSREILEEYRRKDSRIIVCDQDNRGLIHALNRGCRLARGEYIARMDHDDISLPHRFERQVDYLAAHPETGILGTWATLIDSHGTPVGALRYPASGSLVNWSLLFRNCVAHPSVMMRKNVLERLDFYNPAARHIEDYDLWSRAVKLTTVENLPEILLRYTLHQDSTCKQHSETQQENAVRLVMYPRITELIGREPDLETVHALRRLALGAAPDAPAQTDALVQFILNLKDCFLNRTAMRAEEIVQVERDTGERLYCLAVNALTRSTFKGLSHFRKAVRCHPRLLFSLNFYAAAIKNPLRKLRRRNR